MLEVIVGIQALAIVALVGLHIRTYDRLFRVAMSRTPSHYRAAEKADRKPEPPSDSLVKLDEATQAVLADVTPGFASNPHPMPHGLGGV